MPNDLHNQWNSILAALNMPERDQSLYFSLVELHSDTKAGKPRLCVGLMATAYSAASYWWPQYMDRITEQAKAFGFAGGIHFYNKDTAAAPSDPEPTPKASPEAHNNTTKDIVPMPWDIARNSIFFPTVARRKREFIDEKITLSSAWATCYYTGPQLSVEREGRIFMAVLHLISKSEAQRNLKYIGTRAEILEAAGYTRGAKSYNFAGPLYENLKKALRLLSSFSVTFETKLKETPDGIPLENVQGYHLIKYTIEGDAVSIEINPQIFEMLDMYRFSRIPMDLWLSFKSGEAKNLYAFITSHQSGHYSGSFEKLAEAIKLPLTSTDPEKTRLVLKESRRRLKKAILELCEANILDPDRSFLVNMDKVQLKMR